MKGRTIGNSKRENNKKIIVFAIISIILVFALRLINLDQDLAPWGQGLYQPADEGPYAFLAINDKTYGTINPSVEYGDEKVPLLVSENFITNVPGNVLNIISFHVFGNNYWGLRFPYVVIGGINILLFGLLLQRLRKKYGKGDLIESVFEYLLILWMTLDFSFFNAGRIVEPTSVRLVFVQLVVLEYLSTHGSRLKFFIIGALTTFSTFLVYITNIFLYLAAALFLLLTIRKDGVRGFFEKLLFFIAGCTLLFIIAEIYYVFVWKTEAIINAIRTVFSFASNSSAELTVNSEHSLLFALILVYARIVSSNPFFYNLPVLFFSSLFAIPMLVRVYKKKDDDLLFMILIIVSFMLQTVVSTDTIGRKMIVVFPVLVSLIYVFIIEDQSVYICLKKRPNLEIIINCFLWLVAILNVIIAFIYRLFFYDWTSGDYSLIDKLFAFIVQVLPLCFVALFGIVGCFLNDKERNCVLGSKKIILFSAIAILYIENIYFCVKNYWVSPQFSEREAMKDLSSYVDGKYVLGGGFQLGFTLYNDMKPIVNTPEEIMMICDTLDGSEFYFFDYENQDNELGQYFNDRFYSEGSGQAFFVPLHDVNRGFETFGYSRNMCLYEVVDADRYHEYLKLKDEEARKEPSINMDSETEKPETVDEHSWVYPMLMYIQRIDSTNPIFANICGDVTQDIMQPIYGDVVGSVFGDVKCPIKGNVYGNIYGNVDSDITGVVYGKIYGQNNTGAIELRPRDYCDDDLKRQYYLYSLHEIYGTDKYFCILGDINYPVHGDVLDVLGDVNSDIYGNVYGNIYGEVKAVIHGEVYGSIIGESKK